MKRPRVDLVVASLLSLIVVFAGCAKRPALGQASSPAPAGLVTSAPAPESPRSAMPPTSADSPAAAVADRPAVREYSPVPALIAIHFDFDKYDIRPGDATTLDTHAQWLKSNPGQVLLIEGHCDERGTNAYNLALGDRRSKAAMSYLVSRGVQSSRITIISYGEERPMCLEHSEACWAKNRRAQFLVKPS